MMRELKFYCCVLEQTNVAHPQEHIHSNIILRIHDVADETSTDSAGLLINEVTSGTSEPG